MNRLPRAGQILVLDRVAWSTFGVALCLGVQYLEIQHDDAKEEKLEGTDSFPGDEPPAPLKDRQKKPPLLKMIQGSTDSIDTPTAKSFRQQFGDEDELMAGLQEGKFSHRNLEKILKDVHRAVAVRRHFIEASFDVDLSGIPFADYDYDSVLGQCCENVIGYTPVPLGVVGPLVMNGRQYVVPMATTEGCLIASTSRGARIAQECGGITSIVYRDGMTRAPVARLPTVTEAVEVKHWIEEPGNFRILASAFNSTTSFGKIIGISVTVAGKCLHLRIRAFTGDAMGMNMVSKGVMEVLKVIQDQFPNFQVLSISGNQCSDKKPAAVNWIEGRGKSVVAEVRIPVELVKKYLHCDAHDIAQLNTQKNLVGSAMAGAIGGFNAHAANVVAAIFIACGQDPAQVVESANCITFAELSENRKHLELSVTMPSLEVGTVGGGTVLAAQSTSLDFLGVAGPSATPGQNATTLAEVVAATVLVSELSLLGALASNELVSSHMRLNRRRSSADKKPCSESLKK